MSKHTTLAGRTVGRGAKAAGAGLRVIMGGGASPSNGSPAVAASSGDGSPEAMRPM